MAKYFWEHGDTRLRPLSEEDVEDYLSADVDSEAKRVLNHSIGLPRSLKSQAESLPVDFKGAPVRLDFAIETLEKEFAGFCAIDQIEESCGNFSTVTFVLESHRQQGHAERAKHMMLKYMFEERRFEKYNTDCVETNLEIMAHFKKIGCVEEGRRRRRVFTKGQFLDEVLFGLTKEEWQNHNRG